MHNSIALFIAMIKSDTEYALWMRKEDRVTICYGQILDGQYGTTEYSLSVALRALESAKAMWQELIEQITNNSINDSSGVPCIEIKHITKEELL